MSPFASNSIKVLPALLFNLPEQHTLISVSQSFLVIINYPLLSWPLPVLPQAILTSILGFDSKSIKPIDHIYHFFLFIQPTTFPIPDFLVLNDFYQVIVALYDF